MLATVLRQNPGWFADGFDQRQQQAFALLINSTTKLGASVPYTGECFKTRFYTRWLTHVDEENSLQAICEITSST